jgi:hypothetical protein
LEYLLRILTKNSDNFSRIYVDVVFNHMTEEYPNATGVGGTTADTCNRLYPGVPYGPEHFNPPCDVTTHPDAVNVSDTEL